MIDNAGHRGPEKLDEHLCFMTARIPPAVWGGACRFDRERKPASFLARCRFLFLWRRHDQVRRLRSDRAAVRNSLRGGGSDLFAAVSCRGWPCKRLAQRRPPQRIMAVAEKRAIPFHFESHIDLSRLVVKFWTELVTNGCNRTLSATIIAYTGGRTPVACAGEGEARTTFAKMAFAGMTHPSRSSGRKPF